MVSVMPKFSKTSLRKLETCDARLQRVFKEVVKHFDCTIIEGHRSEKRQLKLLRQGFTKLRRGNHNSYPSKAVDVIPYPIDWHDRERMHYFAGQVIATAASMGIQLRWGGDWDQDTEIKDNRFDDLVHFELLS